MRSLKSNQTLNSHAGDNQSPHVSSMHKKYYSLDQKNNSKFQNHIVESPSNFELYDDSKFVISEEGSEFYRRSSDISYSIKEPINPVPRLQLKDLQNGDNEYQLSDRVKAGLQPQAPIDPFASSERKLS